MSRSPPGEPRKVLAKSFALKYKSSRYSQAASRDHIARAGFQEEDGQEEEAGLKGTDSARRAAGSILKQEQFVRKLSQHVVKFWKGEAQINSQQPSTWSARPAGELWRRARQVLLLQREARDFRAQVQDWYKKYPALERPKHTDLVSITERQEQRLAFWAKYRSRAEARDLPPSSLPPPPAVPGQANVLGRGLPRDCADAIGGPLETCGNFWGKVAAKDAKNARGKLRAQARASAKGDKRSVLAGLANAVASSVGNSKKGVAPSEAHSLSWTRRAARDTCYKHKGWALGRRLQEQALCLQECSSAPELLAVDAEQVEESEAEQERSPQLLRLLPDITGAPGAKLRFARVGEDELEKRRDYGRKTAARWQEQMRTVVDDPDSPLELSPVHPRDSRHHKGHQWEFPSVGCSTSKNVKKQLVETQESIASRPRWNTSKRAGFAQKSTSLPNLTQREAVNSLHRPRASINVGKKSKKGGGVEVLPPIEGAFGEGWRDETNASDVHTSPTKRYVRACHHFGVLPTPSMSFVTGQSLKLKAGDKALVDSDLLAVAAMIRSMDRIEEVDLEDNTLLTDKALVVFLRKLFGKPASLSLERLSIKRCLHAGRGTALDIIVQLIAEPDGLICLRHLDLSGVPLSARCHLALCNAIWDHPALNSVSLADTGLGNGPFTEQCVTTLLSSGLVQSLDIGWNTFNTEAFMNIGERMVRTQALRSLSLANCSPMSDNVSNTSILFFLEHLARDRSLTFLDISLNRIDFKGALVIEDALEYHAGLTKMNIAHNPLGIWGIRSFLRLLARGSSGLLQLICDGCCALKHPTPPDALLFHVTRPERPYSLDLSQPYDRALLRMLYKTCERLDLLPSDSFLQVQFTPPPFEHPCEKDASGLWPVPLEGSMTADFSLCSLKVGDHPDLSDSEFIELFDEHMSLMKVHIESRKAAAMVALWQSMEGRVKEQRVIVDAIRSDLLFGYPFFEQLCKHHPFVSEIASCLLPCVTGGLVARHLSTLLSPTLEEQLALYKRLSALREFNIENPTGHYQLDLSDALQAAIGERLLCLDAWEALLAQQRQQEDTSQRGNYSQIRNEEYQNVPLRVPVVASWILPNHGVLKFDYVSGRRPPANALELRQDVLSQLLLSLRQSDMNLCDQVKALRQVSSLVFLTSMQLRVLIVNIGRDRFVAEELAVIFFMRIIDMCNQKQFRIRCPDAEALARRLGYVQTFPFMQPENCDFEFDFEVYEQRLAGKILALLLAREPNTSIESPSYIYPDGKQDLLPKGVPRLWAEAPPHDGTFRGKYICSPDDRQLAERRWLFETYGHWTCDTSQIIWWTGLTEVPEDVIMYLQLIIGKYQEVAQAFRQIDGFDGNGEISLREFEESIHELNNPKFEGATGKRRMLGIFRYLDGNQLGTVTLKEWTVLEQLWCEMTSSIVEFIEGIERAFLGNLAAAWQEMDADGNGLLDEDEWCAAVEQVGYFGPAKVVFHFLDKDGAGRVSKPQFLELRSFRRSPYRRRKALVKSRLERHSHEPFSNAC